MTSTPPPLLVVFFSLPSSPQVRFSLQVQVFLLQPPPDPDARRGPWETLARDRLRFARRCALLSPVLQPILQPSHRERVWERLQGGESLWGPPSPPPPRTTLLMRNPLTDGETPGLSYGVGIPQ